MGRTFVGFAGWCVVLSTTVLDAADDTKVVEPFLVRSRSDSAVFSPNSELCLMGDGALINLSRKNLLNDFKSLGAATFHPNSRMLAMITDFKFVLHDIRLKKDLLKVSLLGHGESSTRDIGQRSAFTSDGKWFLTTGYQDEPDHPRALFIFDFEKRKLAKAIGLGKSTQVGIALLPDDERVLIATDKLRLLEFESAETVWERPLPKQTRWFWCDPKGASVFVRYQIKNIDEVQVAPLEKPEPPQVVLTAPTLRRVISSHDGTAIFGIESQGLLLRRVLPDQPVENVEAHEGDIEALALSPDGKYVITGGSDWRLRVWNAKTLEPVCFLRPARATVRRIEVSPDGKYLAAVVGSDTYIWTMASIQSLAKSVLK
ncbi:MAG TPA: WD40 repeat domain-containing protein [Planctomycetaceae bacterium]|nr:WD40 repeat domain-containing protein [Planctomycetaceae bacterium]